MDLLLATRNAHKTREFAEILGPEFRINDLSGLASAPEINETGKTFEENAILKAVAVSKNFPGPVLADDSGLEVDALGGAPGIFSARYAGKEASDRENIDKLRRELSVRWRNFSSCDPAKRQVKNLPHFPSARFRCAIALAGDGKLLGTFEGAVEGAIVDPARGENGFGYDPIFVPAGYERTFAEMSPEIKNQLSHRARALDAMRKRLRQLRSA